MDVLTGNTCHTYSYIYNDKEYSGIFLPKWGIKSLIETGVTNTKVLRAVCCF